MSLHICLHFNDGILICLDRN